MSPVEIEEILCTMNILVDTREQTSEKSKKRYAAFSHPYHRQKLDFGDYSAEFSVNNEIKRLNAAIERKMDLDELAACFTHDRKRFKAEFERAKEAGATMYLLVEDASWEKLMNGRYRSRFNSNAFLASLTAWIARYELRLVFCKSETSGKLIDQILYRELKERLERGDYE